jgi:hypothetical protein
MAKWTEQEISILKANWKSMMNFQLNKIIPNHSTDSIRKKLKSLGIKLNSDDLAWRAKHAQSFVNTANICKVDQNITIKDLDNVVLQVLLGSMLGDGGCNKQSNNRKNYRFCENHGLKQTGYLQWKSNILSLFQPKFYVRKKSVNLIALTHPVFTMLHEKFYLHSMGPKSLIPMELLSEIDLLGFMIWYLDDGNLGSSKKNSNPNLNIAAKGWNYDGLINLTNFLNDKYGLSIYVYTCKYKDNDINKVVKIPAKDRSFIFSEWQKLAKDLELPQEMWYKLNLK